AGDRQGAPASPRLYQRPEQPRTDAGSMHRPYPRTLLVDPRNGERRRDDVTPRTVRPSDRRAADPRVYRDDDRRRDDGASRPTSDRRAADPRAFRDDDPRRDDGVSRPTSDRVREMYRNLSQPRETRERDQAPDRREPPRQDRSRQDAGPRQQPPPRVGPSDRPQQSPPRARLYDRMRPPP